MSLEQRKLRKKPKKKGKRPGKREQALMVAMKDMGKSTYEIGALLGRSYHTVQRYLVEPMFHDKRFLEMVDEYKTKEITDLTVLNIEARARLHDLAPMMTPIEAIALMDKSFQQRRLLEGKSTENVFSLKKIISDAHKSTATEEVEEAEVVEHATEERQEQESYQREHIGDEA